MTPDRASVVEKTLFVGQTWGAVALLRIMICCGTVLGAPLPPPDVQGINKPTSGPEAEQTKTGLADAGCRRCHTCDRPTETNRCLMTCTRHAPPERVARPPDRHGPDVVILDELENAYLPVPFDHKGHAVMAEMGQGCVTCHHYTPEGMEYPACKTCHDVSSAGTDILKPGLKGAYHQQCLNCHREWIDEKDCGICHWPKAGGNVSGEPARLPTKDDILGFMHPPIPLPDTGIYRSGAGKSGESRTIFRHREHVERFGLRCVECHHEPSCKRCHTPESTLTPQRTLTEHHMPCVKCHKAAMEEGSASANCNLCHWREGQPRPPAFDHAATGWRLNRFHEKKSCRDCHKTVPFTKLVGDCKACHSDWKPSTFDHRVTGQALDEKHATSDCELCHTDRKFDVPPTCSECHEGDEGISFPARRPGALTTPRNDPRQTPGFEVSA